MKILEFHMRIIENHLNLIIQRENHENHENPKSQCEIIEKHKKTTISRENHKNLDNPIIP